LSKHLPNSRSGGREGGGKVGVRVTLDERVMVLGYSHDF
jgi:hypothetical protein